MLNNKIQFNYNCIFNALWRQNSDTLSSDLHPADDDSIPGPGAVTYLQFSPFS